MFIYSPKNVFIRGRIGSKVYLLNSSVKNNATVLCMRLGDSTLETICDQKSPYFIQQKTLPKMLLRFLSTSNHHRITVASVFMFSAYVHTVRALSTPRSSFETWQSCRETKLTKKLYYEYWHYRGARLLIFFRREI